MRIVVAIRLLASLAAAGLAAGCASPPMKYYTLSPAQWVATGSSQRTLQAVVAVRSVPAGLDTAALVVRRGDTQVDMAEGARWTAPFADEVREALNEALRHEYGIAAVDISPSHAPPLPRVDVSVRKFDAAVGDSVSLIADWTVTWQAPEGAPMHLACRSLLKEGAGMGLDGVVKAGQALVIRLAHDAGGAVAAIAANRAPECRSDPGL
jgi:uncharacterized lipoprotein YmbA